jgi:hypothetical protein
VSKEIEGWNVNRAVIKAILVVMTASLIFVGCSKNTAANKNVSASSTDVRTNPEETVKTYYNSEASKDADFLSGFFLNSKMSQTEAVKKQLNDFDVKKIQLVKIYNEKKHGNLIAMICAYDTYFKGIKNPRPDVEVVTVVEKTGKWYFLNDYGNLSDGDLSWVSEVAQQQESEIANNKEIEGILKQKDSFNTTNSAFMDNAMKSMPLQQSSNN